MTRNATYALQDALDNLDHYIATSDLEIVTESLIESGWMVDK